MKRKVILSVAMFTKQKGLDYLLGACKMLMDKNIDFELWLVGEGSEENHLRDEVKNLGLNDRVLFKGIVGSDKIKSYYQSSDVVVLPSIDEGFGMVLVEAQLCYRPVIGTRSGGIPDIIEDNISGLLVEPKDSFALFNAIYKVLVNEELANDLAEQGYNSAIKKFDPEVIGDRFIELLEKVIG